MRSAAENRRLEILLDRIHQVLLVALIALRPLIWDGDGASPSNLVYLGLVLVAVFTLACEYAAGLRREWRWGWAGVVFTALILALVPACGRAVSPVEGWGFGLQLAVHGLLAGYLLQVIPGRQRHAMAALVAGLGIEAGLALMQSVWVLPAMAAAQRADTMAIAIEGVPAGDFAQRIAEGGLFGTFTLSNTLAAYLILTIPALLAAWHGFTRPLARTLLVTVALAAGLALVGTASKGAWLAALAVAGLCWMLLRTGWTRWLPVAGGLVGLAALVLHPAWGHGLAESARVRWGYWQGAWQLVTDQPWIGHGFGAFAVLGPAAMPLWAETARMVHNEYLELAVIAGLPVAGLLLVQVALLVRPRPATAEIPDGGSGATLPAGWWIGGFAFLGGYLALLGAWAGNLGWWPGGEGLGSGAWGLVIGAVLGGLVAGLLSGAASGRMQSPGPWFAAGMAALALHLAIDFDLHSFACLGTLVIVACLASPAPVRPADRRLALPLFLVLTVVTGGLVWWGTRAMAVRTADDTARVLALARDPAHREEALQSLAWIVDRPVPQDEAGRAEVQRLAFAQAWQGCAGEPSVAVRLVNLLPPGRQRLPYLEGLSPAARTLMPWATAHAQDLAASDAWPEAIAEMRRAVALTPSFLPLRQDLVQLLERAVQADPVRADAWRDAIAAERQRLNELQGIVYPRNRMR